MKADSTNFVRLIRKGKEEGILYVIEHYGAYLRSIVARRLFALPDQVDDCMNDIFFGIWKNISSFNEEKGTFINWAAAVARLKAVDYLRKASRELKSVSLDGMDTEPSQEDAALAALVEQELSDGMRELLSCLGEKDRELFLRVYGREEDPGKAGAEMGLTKNSVYVRLFRGKKKMRAFAASQAEHPVGNRKGV